MGWAGQSKENLARQECGIRSAYQGRKRLLQEIHDLKACRILLLEDEPLVAMDLEATLEDIGFENMVITPSVEGAMQAIARQEFDIAFLDVNVEGGTSIAIAEILNPLPTSIIFSSGCVIERSILQKFNAQHLEKPFSIKSIENAVRNALATVEKEQAER